jgi:multimeric flavodoxin WrbA
MAKIGIFYDSYYGHTEQAAKVMAEGARSVKGTEVRCKHVNCVTEEDLRWADGIALGAPVYLGTTSWQMKKAIDEVFGKLWVKGELQGKVGAVFATAGSGGAGGAELTLLSLATALAMHGMTLIPQLMNTPSSSPDGMHWGPVWTTLDGKIPPTEAHLKAFKSHGRYIAQMTHLLCQS